MSNLELEDILSAAEADDNLGFCTACGEVACTDFCVRCNKEAEPLVGTPT